LSDLLDESSANKEYVLRWNRNPEEFDFRFVKSGENLLLEIYQFPTEEREAKNRELVYSHRGKVREVCEAFYETFAQLYEDRNTDDFEFNWHQPFPFDEFFRFESKIKNTLTNNR
jgi:hypothetical protein